MFKILPDSIKEHYTDGFGIFLNEKCLSHFGKDLLRLEEDLLQSEADLLRSEADLLRRKSPLVLFPT